jgi:hypothetical protein
MGQEIPQPAGDRKPGDVTGTFVAVTPGHIGPDLTLSAAIGDSIDALCRQHGGQKNVADLFVGKGGGAVDRTTISKWGSDPHRFPAPFVLILAKHDPVFRNVLVQSLRLLEEAESDLVKSLSPQAQAEVRAVSDDMLRRWAYGPGGAGEHY